MKGAGVVANTKTPNGMADRVPAGAAALLVAALLSAAPSGAQEREVPSEVPESVVLGAGAGTVTLKRATMTVPSRCSPPGACAMPASSGPRTGAARDRRLTTMGGQVRDWHWTREDHTGKRDLEMEPWQEWTSRAVVLHAWTVARRCGPSAPKSSGHVRLRAPCCSLSVRTPGRSARNSGRWPGVTE